MDNSGGSHCGPIIGAHPAGPIGSSCGPRGSSYTPGGSFYTPIEAKPLLLESHHVLPNAYPEALACSRVAIFGF